jgi:phenylalanyl-tRNA synthetase beta chain
LTPENLVIADTAGPIAIAGVMGGLDTEVSAATTNILLESANFDFVSIRRTMKDLNLPSEASLRFSKGIHPEIVQSAVERAADLMRAHAGGTVAAGLVDTYPAPLPAQVVELTMSEVRRQLGMEVPVGEAIRILRALEFHVETVPTDPEKKEPGPSAAPILRVTTPPHRRDVQAGTADLIEELVRIHGYDRLPATLMADPLPEQHTNRSLAVEERLRDLLVDCGFQEVITYALTEIQRDAPVGLGQGEYVALLNPISSERVVMRHSLLGEMLEVAADNLRHTETLRLFQIGSVYLLPGGKKLPEEPRRLALLMTGRRQPEFWADGTGTEAKTLDFFDLKGVFEGVSGDLHLAGVSYRRPADGTYPYLHPGQAAEFLIDEHEVGSFGQLHPRYAEQRGLGQRIILAGELDLERILAAVPLRYAYTPVPRFPAALRDIAVIVDEEVTAERIVAEIRAAGG